MNMTYTCNGPTTPKPNPTRLQIRSHPTRPDQNVRTSSSLTRDITLALLPATLLLLALRLHHRLGRLGLLGLLGAVALARLRRRGLLCWCGRSGSLLGGRGRLGVGSLATLGDGTGRRGHLGGRRVFFILTLLFIGGGRVGDVQRGVAILPTELETVVVNVDASIRQLLRLIFGRVGAVLFEILAILLLPDLSRGLASPIIITQSKGP